MAKYGNNPEADQSQSRRSGKPDPRQADWIMRKKNKRPKSPLAEFSRLQSSLSVHLFVLQSTDVCDDVSDLRISELAGVSRHLALAILGDGNKIGVRLAYDIGRTEGHNLCGLAGRRIAASVSRMAHLTFRFVDIRTGILSKAHCADCKQTAGDDASDVFQHY
jgi:hypothetical protein